MLFDIPLTPLALVLLGGFLGGMASGAAGFAYGVVASAIWLHVISPLHTTLLVVSGGFIVQSGMVFAMRRSVDLRRLWPFLVPGLIGIPIGVALVVKTDQNVLRAGIALFLVVYGVFALTTPRLPNYAGGGRIADAVIGFLGGLIGGLSGLSGILPAIWTQVRGWPRDVARGVYQPYILVAQGFTLALIGAVALDRRGIVLLVCVMPAIFLGTWVGWKIYGMLDERQFQRLFAILLVTSGILLLT